MSRKYFGTDGVRGKVGEAPLTVDFALRLASAAARVLAPTGGTVLIGKDTRLSGYMFEAALEAGFVAAGVNVMLIGPLPTPGIAYLTRKFGCSFGVVISASHNTYDDNGIKFFDRDGGKLSDEIERSIETELDRGPITRSSKDLGRASRVDKSRRHYQEFCAESLPKGMTKETLAIMKCRYGEDMAKSPQGVPYGEAVTRNANATSLSDTLSAPGGFLRDHLAPIAVSSRSSDPPADTYARCFPRCSA